MAAPAGAAEDGLLVVEGRGGTSTVVTIGTRPVVMDPVAAIAAGGSYAGALVEPADGPPAPRLLALQVRAFDAQTRGARFSSGFGELPPGRYRVTLLGTGPVRVAWTLRDGDAGVRVTPASRIPVTFLGRAEQQTSGYSEARVDLPGAAPAGRRVLQVLIQDGTRVEDARMCATTGTECAGNPAPVCPPLAPCGDPLLPSPSVSTGEVRTSVLLHPAAPVARRLLWSAEGYRTEPGRLRAAAILF